MRVKKLAGSNVWKRCVQGTLTLVLKKMRTWKNGGERGKKRVEKLWRKSLWAKKKYEGTTVYKRKSIDLIE